MHERSFEKRALQTRVFRYFDHTILEMLAPILLSGLHLTHRDCSLQSIWFGNNVSIEDGNVYTKISEKLLWFVLAKYRGVRIALSRTSATTRLHETKASTTVSRSLVACFKFSHEGTALAYTACWGNFSVLRPANEVSACVSHEPCWATLPNKASKLWEF